MKKLSLVLAFLLLCTAKSRALDSLVTAIPAGTDLVDWAQFGPPPPSFSFIDCCSDNPFNFSTTNLIPGSGTWGDLSSTALGEGLVVTEGNGWFGDFQNGATLNYDEDSGPLTLSFAGYGYTQIGAQIQPNSYGAFTAQICDNNDSICVTESGVSDQAEDNSAIYIGISNSSPISSVTFSLTSVPSGDINDFAISDVTLVGGAPLTPVPEGGVPLLYLLLDAASFGGAIFLGSKRNQAAQYKLM